VESKNANKEVEVLLSKTIEELGVTEEDKKLLQKLALHYCKKKDISRMSPENVAGGILWQYSRMNGFWEGNKDWSLQNIAMLIQAKPKTIGNTAGDIVKTLKIEFCDERYCRKEVSDQDPFKQFAMLQSGFIIPRDTAEERGLPHIPLKKSKEDYYYDGCDCIGGNDSAAIRLFKKALTLDDEYVEAYNGLGTVYFDKNPTKAREYFKKAYTLTVQHFKGKWPKELCWGILENRQYLRAIHYHGLVLWRDGNADEAMKLFKLLLQLNNNDNQGIRYLVAAIYEGISWDNLEEGDLNKEEALFNRQNKIHKFYTWNGDK
jgi:tetratricopeptide (TPR) repeat protein